MAQIGVTYDDIAETIDRKIVEVDERVRRFRRGRPPPDLAGRTVIVVDDGIATGGTVRAALRTIRRRRPGRLVLATPVAAATTLASLRSEVDEVVCLDEDPYLEAIGAYYLDFTQTTDEDVMSLLDRAASGVGPAEVAQRVVSRAGSPKERCQSISVDIEVEGVYLEGDLAIPAGAAGLVLFAHGSGSSRKSPRNRRVAAALQDAGLATLLFDLLTSKEEARDEVTAELRFDVEFLAARLLGATLAARAARETSAFSIGYFGASTGAAAALIAAAQRPDLVSAVVSRGGRPDLAGRHLEAVVAPTLLLVGGADTEVLALNREASTHVRGPCQLAIVRGATHLFEEPGALDEVARLAGEWFVRYLGAQPLKATG